MIQTHTWRKDDMKRHREKTAVYKPKREAWNRSFLHSPQRKPILPSLEFGLLASGTLRQ